MATTDDENSATAGTAAAGGVVERELLDDESGALGPPLPPPDPVEELELQVLLEALFRRYGFDFRDYAFASLRRRVLGAMQAEGLPSISALQGRLLRDTAAMERFLAQATVNVTSMFRDPSFFQALREKVIPLLASYPYVRIWHAGCATGEEVFSMAILLHEAGLLERCRIYGTDMNEIALARAREGIFPLRVMQEYSTNYLRAGGAASLSEYFNSSSDAVIFKSHLRRHVLFSHHNLVTDGSFNEFNLILCRNVMIYFNGTLQARVHRLLFESLRRLGVLCIGRSESLRGSPNEAKYEELDGRERIFRRVG